MPKTLIERWMRWIFRRWNLLDLIWSRWAFNRSEKLTSKPLSVLFPGAEEFAVWLKDIPQGNWSTPFADGVVIGKLLQHRRSTAVLEVGTYLGYTTSIMALNALTDTTITSVDICQLNSPIHKDLAARVKFMEVEFSAAAFETTGFDFVFIDADHQFESVLKDSIRAISLVTNYSLIVWHDYAPWGLGTGFNGVPRFLSQLARHLPIYSLEGTTLCVLEIRERATLSLANEILAKMRSETNDSTA